MKTSPCPCSFPRALLQKEKDHVEGFAPEVAWVTYGGSEKLAERLCVRPTSETLFCEHYAHISPFLPRPAQALQPVVLVLCAGKRRPAPSCARAEFLWQEGHTMHETDGRGGHRGDRATCWTSMPSFAQEQLCHAGGASGRKTDKEKFAGAEATYTIEAMMHDGKALQCGTSHYFGDGFAKAFEHSRLPTGTISSSYPHQTSWGMSDAHHRRHHHDPRRRQRPGTAPCRRAGSGGHRARRLAQGRRFGNGAAALSDAAGRRACASSWTTATPPPAGSLPSTR